MGFVGGALRAFDNSKPKFDTIDIKKNPEIQKLIERGIGGVGTSLDEAESAGSRFRNRFLSQTPQVEQFTQQGIGEISDLFSGRTGAQLQGLRSQRRDARRAATDRTLGRLQSADARRRARLGIPGGNSFLDFQSARLARDAEISGALEDADLARADFNRLQQQRLGNLDTRQRLLNSLAQRETVPATVLQALRAAPLSTLGALQRLDDLNAFRGLSQRKSTLEQFAQFADAADQGIMSAASIVGSIGGLGGGGGGFGAGGGGGGGSAGTRRGLI